MDNKKMLHVIAFILVIVGALNWGLVGLLNFNLVMFIFGAWPMLEQIVYILVGLSAIYLLATHSMDCSVCSMEMKMKGKKK